MSEIIFRGHRSGDLGWIVHRHGVVYAGELGWPDRLEGIVAGLMSDFSRENDPERERFYIAERDGQFLGCILVSIDRTVDDGGKTAKLRVFLVERTARRLGIGRQLLEKSIDYAREKGYKKVVLMTESSLTPARRLYAAAGFQLTRVRDCGDYAPPGSKEETWELDL
jgi:GNAT superfamily N-acetyltransferase